jgi:hypothetical protein
MILLVCVGRYALSYVFFNWYGTAARISYRAAFVAAAVTYGIVVYKGFRARTRMGNQPQNPMSMAADENVQYFCEPSVPS